jgi:HSP20 family molecular chaperone IbpA
LEVSVPGSGDARVGVPEGKYEVCFEVPAGAGPDAIDAALRYGVLRIRISKENAGARRVPIISDEQDGVALAP